jgi:alpha,alpha-trehalose phosphorylase
MTSGTLDREVLLETPAGKHVAPFGVFAERRVAAISYCVTLLNAPAHLVTSSEMSAEHPTVVADTNDPRQTRVAADRVLYPRRLRP